MKTNLKKGIALLLVAGSFSVSSCVTQKEIKKEIKLLDVDAVFQNVYNSVQKAVAKAGPKKYAVESIDIEFGTTNTINGTAGITLFIVSGKYSRSYAKAKSAKFHFAPDPEKTKMEDDRTKKFVDYLASVITAAEKVQIKDDFALQEFSAEVGFTITESGELAAEADYSPITPSLGFSKESEYVHTITVNFAKKIK